MRNNRIESEKNILNLTMNDVMIIMKKINETYRQKNSTDYEIQLSRRTDVGFGGQKPPDEKGHIKITIGIAPYSDLPIFKDRQVNDLDIMQLLITEVHELTHLRRETSLDTDDEIEISSLSKCMNKKLYLHNWPRMPHEIDAEYNAVMEVWSVAEELWGDRADTLMFKYLEHRAKNTDYMIGIPEGGFQTKEQVDALFNDAYQKAVEGPMNDGYGRAMRELPPGYLEEKDELSKMFAEYDETGRKAIIRYEYIPFRDGLLKSKTGAEFDRKVASLVAYVHPELQELYPSLDFKKLDPEIVFGVPMPESPKEIMDRIYQDEKNQTTDRIRSLKSLISRITGVTENRQNRDVVTDRKGNDTRDTAHDADMTVQEKDISEECRKLEHDLVTGLEIMKQDSHQITL